MPLRQPLGALVILVILHKTAGNRLYSSCKVAKMVTYPVPPLLPSRGAANNGTPPLSRREKLAGI